MECPGCHLDMSELQGEDLTLRKCGECMGLWIDVADLNRMLLHNNLSGLESQGGKLDAEALTGQCSDCLVDLVRVDGGDRQRPLHYDTCESCGGIFIEAEFEEITDVAGAERQIVDFFKAFAAKRKSALA